MDGRLIAKSKRPDKEMESETERVWSVCQCEAVFERKTVVSGWVLEREREGAQFCAVYWGHAAPESQMN